MKLVCSIFLFAFTTLSIASTNSSVEHPHAKILGALVYTDISITSDGEEATAVLHQIRKELGILMQVYWENSHFEGISKTAPIFLTLENKPAVVVLERIMEQLSEDEAVAWQIRDGVLEVGFKSRFSKKTSLQLIQYPISDLLFTVRNFDNEPKMGSGGGGNSGSGLTIGFGAPGNEPERKSKQQKIDKIIALITKFIEPDQWEENGGDCTIDSFQETLLVNAPDYMHRQIGGYPYRPIRPANAQTRRVDYSKGKTSVRVPRSSN
ncbi:MAG: hypothetical protein H8E86_02310 [Planctomycetes bacterium]|nr:hypothetical protein [Planctomycetota bacterium]